MKTNSRTRLELIMNVTGASGKEIASFLHVDMSLVSRWKSGKRTLTNMDTLLQLADFFTAYDEEQFTSTIRLLIGLESSDFESFRLAFSSWLGKPLTPEDTSGIIRANIESPSSETIYRTYMGNDGRRQAALYLFDKIMGMKKPIRFYLYSNEDMSWMTQDPQFLTTWTQSLIKILKQGHEIIIIHTMTRSFKELMQAVLNWVPIYLAGKIQAWQLKSDHQRLPWQTIFYIENIMVCSGYMPNNNWNNRFTVLTNDRLTITTISQTYQDMIDNSIPLISAIKGNQALSMWDQFTSVGQNVESSDFKSNEIFFTFFKPDHLSDLLLRNKISKNTHSTFMTFYEELTHNFSKNVKIHKNRHIYNLEALKEKCYEESFEFNHLSVLIGQPVILTQKDYKRLLESAIDRIRKHNLFEVALFIPSITPIPLVDTNMWIKDNYFTAVWAKEKQNHLIMSFQPTMIEAFHFFFNQLWDQISFIDKSKDHVISHFEKMIAICDQ